MGHHSAPAITLYDCATAPSPSRARIVLAEKCVAHETVQVNLHNGEQLIDAYHKIDPQCTVPALRTLAKRQPERLAALRNDWERWA